MVQDLEIQLLLLLYFLNINLQDHCKETALIKAVNNDKIELVKTLINEFQPAIAETQDSVIVNKINSDSCSVLHINPQSIEKLEHLSKKINIYRNNKENQLKNYIDISIKDSSGYNAKKIAYIYGNKEIEKLIDDYGKTIIHN